MAAKKISKQPAPSKSGTMQSRVQSRVQSPAQSRVKTPAKSSVKTPAKSSASTRRTVVPAPISSSEAQAQLRSLAMNLWWTWNEIAQRPFAALRSRPVERQQALAAFRARICGTGNARGRMRGAGFRLALADARAALAAELARQTWWAQDCAKANPNTCVAYFCSEFALHESIQQYSGGLGVLAYDHLKSASDLGVPLVGVGLYYRHGYYIQQFADDGATKVLYPVYDRNTMPISDTGIAIECPIGGRKVKARVLRMDVGRTRVFLLDADLAENAPEDRLLTEGLYKGEPELRMRQQVLLGVGGMLALRALGIAPSKIHLNEGHAAFAAIEMLAEFRASGMAHADAVKAVRARTVFTTHTPVAMRPRSIRR